MTFFTFLSWNAQTSKSNDPSLKKRPGTLFESGVGVSTWIGQSRTEGQTLPRLTYLVYPLYGGSTLLPTNAGIFIFAMLQAKQHEQSTLRHRRLDAVTTVVLRPTRRHRRDITITTTKLHTLFQLGPAALPLPAPNSAHYFKLACAILPLAEHCKVIRVQW